MYIISCCGNQHVLRDVYTLCSRPFCLGEPFCSEWDCSNQESMSNEENLADYQSHKINKKQEAAPSGSQ